MTQAEIGREFGVKFARAGHVAARVEPRLGGALRRRTDRDKMEPGTFPYYIIQI